MTSFGRSQFTVLRSMLIACVLLTASHVHALNIAVPKDGSILEQQAAKELRRYIFLRTGKAPALDAADNYAGLPAGDVIVVAANASPIITELKAEYGNVDAPSSDNRMGYIIKSIAKDSRNILVITGADTYTTLRAAYRFAELIGCHFNLAGDVIPDKKLSYPIDISGYDEKCQPWFELRGCLPFHNFTAGPDMWNTADYKSFITQQAKMGFNFFALHHYFRGIGGGEGPEPHVWIGHKNDVNPDGTIKPEAAYKSYWSSSFRGKSGKVDGIWGTPAFGPSQFTNGSGKLFAHDYCASEAIGSKVPTTPEEMAANFNNVGVLLNKAFTHAKQLGVKTAIGTEAPMGFEPGSHKHLITKDWIRTCPPHSQARMWDVHGYALPTARGKENEAFAKALYEGMFTRIIRTHPLDYFWLWTYETWAYLGHKPSHEQVEAVADDYRYCHEVMKEMNAPFKMAAFGWKVGSVPAGSVLEFDDDLPKDVPFGTLWDEAEGMKHVIAAGREGWSSVWYEEDWGLMQLQLRSKSIFNETGASLRKGGGQALLAKHWRINSCAQASAAHAKLVWDNKASVSEPMPTIEDGAKKYPRINVFSMNLKMQPPEFVKWITEHYTDWARANFGPERAKEIGALLAMADRLGEPKPLRKGMKGAIPRVAGFLPSAVREVWPEDGDPVSDADPRFVAGLQVYRDFCKYEDDIVGTGNKDRYMYWYHFFQGQIELAKLALQRREHANERTRSAATEARIISTWSKLMSHEMQRIRNESELAVIAQLQQNSWHKVFERELGITETNTTYEGAKAVRAMPEISMIYLQEDFEQKVIFIGNGDITEPTMYYRKLGSSGKFSTAPVTPVGNNVMKAKLPNPGYDFEYYIQGAVGGKTVTYPVTGGHGADNINKTVITVEKADFAAKFDVGPSVVGSRHHGIGDEIEHDLLR